MVLQLLCTYLCVFWVTPKLSCGTLILEDVEVKFLKQTGTYYIFDDIIDDISWQSRAECRKVKVIMDSR